MSSTRRLHPQFEALLAQMAAQQMPAFADLSIQQARELVMGFRGMQGEPEPVESVRDLEIPGPQGPIPARVYTPTGATGPRGGIVSIHGGGFTGGNIEVGDNACRSLANACATVVVAIDYRLSPEHKFPEPLEDCYSAVQWISENAADLGIDPTRLAVFGDSAGGNLAAATALLARDRGGPALAAQILVYPVIAPPSATNFPSHRQNAEGYLLNTADMQWFWNHYLRDDTDATDGYAAPLFAEDVSGLPPLWILTAEFDALRDEGQAYAQRLSDAGVTVTSHHYEDMTHGFLWMDAVIDRYRDLINQIATDHKSLLS